MSKPDFWDDASGHRALFTVAKYLETIEDHQRLAKVRKSMKTIPDEFKYNPVSYRNTEENDRLMAKTFRNIENQVIYKDGHTSQDITEGVNSLIRRKVNIKGKKLIFAGHLTETHQMLLRRKGIIDDTTELYGIVDRPLTPNNIGPQTRYFSRNLMKKAALVDLTPSPITKMEELFKNCTALTEIKLPDTLLEIGNYSFKGCENLVNIIIPSSVTSIERGAFNDCSSLSYITLPPKLKKIGSWCFADCVNLNEILIPSSVNTIGDYAFCNCFVLSSVKFETGSKLYNLGIRCFEYCTSLREIYLPITISALNENEPIQRSRFPFCDDVDINFKYY